MTLTVSHSGLSRADFKKLFASCFESLSEHVAEHAADVLVYEQAVADRPDNIRPRHRGPGVTRPARGTRGKHGKQRGGKRK